MTGPGRRSQLAERNLIFAGLGMQLGILSREKVIRAFTEWLLEKDTPLGEILQNQNALTTEQRKLLDDACEAHILHEGSKESALASLRQVKDLESDLEHLDDADIQKSVQSVHSTRIVASPNPGSFHSILEEDPPSSFIPLSGSPSDRFDPLQFLDAGSLGEVYFARDRELNRMVVVKFIKPEQSQNPLNRALFQLEGEVTGYLEHPNITPVYGLGKDGKDRSYYAMRYIRGRKLTKAISDYHSIPTRDKGFRHETLIGLLQGFQSACLAVAYAHSRGVIHCDIKPDNIMVGEFGETMVVDWGLVVVKNHQHQVESDPEITQDRFAETKTFSPSQSAHGGLHEKQGGARNYVGGTPAYMAPEQMKASDVGDIDLLTPSSDVFGLGATLYHILTGRAPLLPEKDKKESKSAYYHRIETATFPKPRSVLADIPKPLEAITLKAMALDPAKRYPSPRELADDLRRWISEEPTDAYRENFEEQIRRWMRNNRVAVSTASVLLVCLSLGAFIFGGITHTYNEQLRESEFQAKKSAEFALAEQEKATQSEKKAQLEEKAAREQKTIAETSEKLARSQQELAETQLYVNKIQRAQGEWDYGDDLVARFQMESCPWDRRGWEHDYLATLMDRNQVTLRGHTGIVTGVAFSPNGKQILSSSGDNSAKLWDALTGAEILTYRGHSSKVSGMAFKRETLFNIRELVTLKNIPMTKEFLNLKERSNRVNGVAFRPDGQWVATASDDKTIKIWETATGKEIRTLMGHLGEVLALAFSPDGSRIVSSSEDKTLKIWETQTGRELMTLKGHGERISAVAFSPDGKKILSGSDDNTARLWNAQDGQNLLVLKGHSFFVTAAAFHPDGKTLATGSLDKSIKLWETLTGKEIRTLAGHSKAINSIAFSPDGNRLVSGGDDKLIKLWNPQAGTELESFKGNTMPVTSVTFSPDGLRIASGSESQAVKVWNAREGQSPETLLGHQGAIACIAVSPDGKWIATGSLDKTTKLWNAQTGEVTATLRGNADRVVALAFHPKSQRLATGSWDQIIRLYDTGSGRLVLQIPAQSHPVNGLAYSPDGKRLVVGTLGGQGKVLDAETGMELYPLKGQISFTTCVAFSSNGRWIAAAGWDKVIRVFEADTGTELLNLKGHTDRISHLEFRHDGKLLASAGDDHSVRIWDPALGKEILQLRGHNGPVNSVVFSSDGKRIASAGEGKAIKIWDATDGRELISLKGHLERVTSLAFSPEGDRLYSSGNDKSLMIWDARDPSDEMVLKFQTSNITQAIFSRDGKRVIAKGEDQSIKFWDAQSGKELMEIPESDKIELERKGNPSPDGDWFIEIKGDEILVVKRSLRKAREERDRQRLATWMQQKK